MSERLGRMESAIEGLRHSQNLVIGAAAIIAALLVGLSIYELQRIDQLNDRVAGLPGQISSDLQGLTRTLAESITAAKQTPPQVILMPAPQPQKK